MREPQSRSWLSLTELETRDVPTFYGNQVFPLDNAWNQKITDAPVASNSDAIINRIRNRHVDQNGNLVPVRLHPDFGNPAEDEALYGMPVNVVDSSVPKVPVMIAPNGWADESDLVNVPIPANAVIEGDDWNGPSDPNNPDDRGDSHLIIYDRDANILYELASVARPNETQYPYGGTKPLGVWGAYCEAVWDLNTNSFRTVGWTSADAAGLPILPGLVRPDEALPVSAGGQGVIDHAIRVTIQQTRNLFVYPASHQASNLSGSDLPRMGERFRLKSSFVIPANWAPEVKAVAQAMKDYGLIVADNGSDMFFGGLPSNQWDMGDMLQIQSVMRVEHFEVVDLTPIISGLSVTSGPTSGGTSVTITGRNFSGAAGRLQVLFGTTPASSFTILSDSQIVAVAPAHAAGTVDVRVQSGGTVVNSNGGNVFWGYGTSAVVAADQFTFGTGSPPVPPSPVPPPPSAGSLQFVASAYSMSEGGGSVTITVQRTGGSFGAVSVNYATSNGTATAPGDYASRSGTLSWANGDTTAKSFTIPMVNDTSDENDETVNLTLSNPTNSATLGTIHTAIFTIIDNDGTSPPPPPPGPVVPPTVPPVPPPPAAPVGLIGIRHFGVGAGTGGSPTATRNGQNGQTFSSDVVFDSSFTGGVRTAMADFNGDGVPDLVVGTGPGTPARVRVLDAASQGVLFDSPVFEGFTGGVFVAAGDITGDGRADVILTPDEGGGPRVVVLRGGDFVSVASFFGIDDANFRGGARAAVGDLNGDGRVDLLVSAGFGGGPRVAAFDGRTVTSSPQHLFGDLFVFETALRNGVYVAAGDIDGDGFADLVAGAGPGGGPRVLTLSGRDLIDGKGNGSRVLTNFFAGDANNRGGIRVAIKDLDNDARADLVVGAGLGGGSRVTGYAGKNFAGGAAPELFGFDAFPGLSGGVFVG